MDVAEFLSDLAELRGELRKHGVQPAVLDAAIVKLVDDVDFALLIPGPIGLLVETLDDPLAKLGLAVKISSLFARKARVRKQRRANQPDPVPDSVDPSDLPTEEPPGN